MKKLILLFAFLFTISSSFTSCRNKVEEENTVAEDELATQDEEVETTEWEENDMNDDGMWGSDEYADAYEEDWSNWDSNSDGNLDDNEFYDTSYGWVDSDNDELINEEEWDEGFNNLFGDYGTEEDFTEYDVNNDGSLDEDEWFQGWGDSDWFNDFDANDDSYVDNNEWETGLFDNWDENDDGSWNEDEYNAYSGYYDTM